MLQSVKISIVLVLLSQALLKVATMKINERASLPSNVEGMLLWEKVDSVRGG